MESLLGEIKKKFSVVGRRRRAANLEVVMKQSVINPGEEVERDSLLLISCLLHSGDLHLLLRSTLIALKLEVSFL